MPHFKATSGIDWFFHAEGQGPYLLMIHGWSVDHRIWRQQIKPLSKEYTVLTLDLPGHGQSRSVKNLSLDAMARDILQILNEQNIKSINVIGSSIGGNVALEIYRMNPKRICSMILVGTMPKFYVDENYLCGISLERKEKLLKQLFHAYPSIVYIFFRSLFTEQERQTRRYKWLQTFHRADVVPSKEILIDYLQIMEDVDQRELMGKVKCPMLLINGTGDEICDEKTVNHMKKNFKRVRFEDMLNLGHFPFLSEPYAFNEILIQFLKYKKNSWFHGFWF